jgi:formate C-acetyltransferase
MSLQVKLAGNDLPTGAVAAPNGIFPIPNDNFDRVRTLADLALTEITLDDFPGVKAWRNKLFSPEGTPEICGELPTLLTEYLRSPAAQDLSPALRRARALHHIFAHKQARVRRDDLLPGSTTTSFVGPPVYMDTIGYCMWPELKSVATRPQNPFRIRPELAARLNREVFPFWMDRHLPVAEAARASAYDSRRFPNRDRVKGPESTEPALSKSPGETPRCQALMERVAFYLSDKATCVSHTVPDWDRLLRHGLAALVASMRHDREGPLCDEEGREFLTGVIAVFEGAMAYAEHLAEAAEQAGNGELATLCRKVPAAPAETLHEALVSIWVCYHLLLQENTNFGLSIGRLDQLLNPFYLRDHAAQPTPEAKEAFVKRAVELVCHFFLRCSDHVPLSTSGSEVLFAGSGSNQALTIGGTRYENGQVVDAVNDMTYLILKATEILGIRDPNVHARYHAEVHHRDAAGRPLGPEETEPYLMRLTQVNILTRATPGIHGDIPVVESMSRYYAAHDGVSHEEALADAHDYASIGCIEQNAAGKHYGNTGSTLFVLPAVLELTLFGGKHRSQGVGEEDPNLLRGDKIFTTPPLTAMKRMDEFVTAFRYQLDALARLAVQNNNYLGRFMERERPSPFLSGLFTGPTNLPGGSGARFRDVAAGGAKYNSAGVAVIGLADVIDSFCVLDALVFGGKVTVQELLAALAADFSAAPQEAGSWWATLLEWLRRLFAGEGKALPTLEAARLAEIRRLIRSVPHYGAGVDRTPGSPCDNTLALHYTALLTRMIHDVFYRYRTHRGGRYLAGYWSMTNHAGFGMLTKATPNGRAGGHSFASGMTPCAGITRPDGRPTMILDQMLSVASVDPKVVQNGYTYNLSLTTRGPGQRRADTELFARYMRSFAVSGGVLVQMCVSSLADLRAADAAATAAAHTGAGAEAQEALARWKDLMIRVAGYSAYFVTLSPQMRREIIDRANFALADGVEQHTARNR